MGLKTLLAEVAQKLIANGTAGEHLHTLTEMKRLGGKQPEEILHQLTVVMAGVFAALGDLIVIEVHHTARAGALNKR